MGLDCICITNDMYVSAYAINWLPPNWWSIRLGVSIYRGSVIL